MGALDLGDCDPGLRTRVVDVSQAVSVCGGLAPEANSDTGEVESRIGSAASRDIAPSSNAIRQQVRKASSAHRWVLTC